MVMWQHPFLLSSSFVFFLFHFPITNKEKNREHLPQFAWKSHLNTPVRSLPTLPSAYLQDMIHFGSPWLPHKDLLSSSFWWHVALFHLSPLQPRIWSPQSVHDSSVFSKLKYVSLSRSPLPPRPSLGQTLTSVFLTACQGNLGFFCRTPQNYFSLCPLASSKSVSTFLVFVTGTPHFQIPSLICHL